MKQDVKVDGIPTNLTVNHNHSVVLEVQLSEHTARQIKDVAITIFTIAATTAIAKSLVGTANRMMLDQNYFKLWGNK